MQRFSALTPPAARTIRLISNANHKPTVLERRWRVGSEPNLQLARSWMTGHCRRRRYFTSSINVERRSWVVKPEDPLDLAEAIRSAASDRDKTSAKGRRAAIYDRAIASYRQVMSDVMRAAG
jgi:hypothetical protein